MQSCMDKYKERFVTKFHQVRMKNLLQWQNSQSHYKQELYSLQSIGSYFLASLLGFIPGKHERDYSFELHCWFAVACFIGAIITNIAIQNKAYQRQVKSTLFSDLLATFDDGIEYHLGLGYNPNKISLNVYKESKLYDPKKITEINTDDIIGGEYNDVHFSMNEVDFGYRGQKNQYYYIFKGLAMHYKLNKQIKSRILILTKYSSVRVPPNYERVELEYEKFNKKYDVWAEKNVMGGTGQIEARYLLNTAFMERFMQLQTSFKVNKMCCSVFGDEMLIMLSTGKDLFEMNHLFGKVDDVNQYKVLFEEFASVLSFIDVLKLSSKTGL